MAIREHNKHGTYCVLSTLSALPAHTHMHMLRGGEKTKRPREERHTLHGAVSHRISTHWPPLYLLWSFHCCLFTSWTPRRLRDCVKAGFTKTHTVTFLFLSVSSLSHNCNITEQSGWQHTSWKLWKCVGLQYVCEGLINESFSSVERRPSPHKHMDNSANNRRMYSRM